VYKRQVRIIDEQTFLDELAAAGGWVDRAGCRRRVDGWARRRRRDAPGWSTTPTCSVRGCAQRRPGPVCTW